LPPDIEDPETEFPTPASTISKTRTTSPSLQTRAEADQTFEIHLKIPQVTDVHPYYGGTKQPRSTVNTLINTQESINNKRELKNRRKRTSSSSSSSPSSSFYPPPIQHQNSIIKPNQIDQQNYFITKIN
jgi:hypothetical protein